MTSRDDDLHQADRKVPTGSRRFSDGNLLHTFRSQMKTKRRASENLPFMLRKEEEPKTSNDVQMASQAEQGEDESQSSSYCLQLAFPDGFSRSPIFSTTGIHIPRQRKY